MSNRINPAAGLSIVKARKVFQGVARLFVAFMRRPQIVSGEKNTLPISPLMTGASLLVLSFAVTAVFAIAALPLFLTAEASAGSQLQQVFSQSTMSVVLAVVVLGPLIEEVMFRGWLSGTWRAIVGSAIFLALVFGAVPIVADQVGVSATIVQLGLAGIGLVIFGLLSPIDGGGRMPHFERAFPYLFWLQGLLFGFLHFRNVATDLPLVTILSTLPLVICAWLWGFARVHIGLWSAVLLHAAYNVPAVIGMLALTTLQGA